MRFTTWTLSDMAKYRAAIWSFLKLTTLYFTMFDIVHRSCWVTPQIHTWHTSPRMEVPLREGEVCQCCTRGLGTLRYDKAKETNCASKESNDQDLDKKSWVRIVSQWFWRRKNAICWIFRLGMIITERNSARIEIESWNQVKTFTKIY